MTADADCTLSAVQKTCRVLASLTDPKVRRLTDIAQRSRLDMATALRILKELESEGFVEREPQTKHYVLGTQVYAMHHSMVSGLDMRTLARPSLIRLSQQFGDTVILSVPVGWESVCLDLCFGTYPIRANYLETGSRRPLGVGASSMALLAAMPADAVRAVMPMVHRVLAERYPRYSEARLASELAKARACGHACLLEVVVEKMGGLGVPVLGPDGTPIAALAIAALTERIADREAELAQALSREARMIARSWLPSPLAQEVA